jgi:hypothetical protein
MDIEGLNVVEYLNGYDTVRDGKLISLSFRDIVSEPVIDLIFEVTRGGATRTVKLELRDIQEFDYGFAKENAPEEIALLKCLMTDTGEFYLSLDPYDEREAFISDKDNDYFRSRFVKLTT